MLQGLGLLCISLDKKKAENALVCTSKQLKLKKVIGRWAVSNPLPQRAVAVLLCNYNAVLHVNPSNIFHPLLLRFHLQLSFLLTPLNPNEAKGAILLLSILVNY